MVNAYKLGQDACSRLFTKNVIPMPKQLFLWFLLLLSGTGLFAQQTMNTMVNFPVNGHELDVTAQAELDQTLKSLELPFHSYRIEIIGHTDADGDLGLNAALSGRRARSVRNWLSHRGVPHFAMETVSEGELKPLSSNASEPGKARNRRVELRFVPNANAHRNPFGKSEPFMETTFDATEAANFTYKPSGSRISIPGNSLVPMPMARRCRARSPTSTANGATLCSSCFLTS
jgi:hypothetical protein